MNAWLYLGKVMHQRHQPMQYRFDYALMSLCVDIDHLAEDLKNIRGLSYNRFNLWSFHDKDYGPRTPGADLRQWFDDLLKQYGVAEPANKVQLVCLPRFLGYGFNPLAVWYAFDQQDNLIAVVCEVSNTFGHWHHYVLVNQGQPLISKSSQADDSSVAEDNNNNEHNRQQNNRIRAKASKQFHVSPFMQMEDDYQFRFAIPDELYQIGIYQKSQGKALLTSTQTAKRVLLDSKQLLLATLRLPLQSIKVIWLIHWWAIKIWLKGGKFHATPKQQRQNQYSHSEIELC